MGVNKKAIENGRALIDGDCWSMSTHAWVGLVHRIADGGSIDDAIVAALEIMQDTHEHSDVGSFKRMVIEACETDILQTNFSNGEPAWLGMPLIIIVAGERSAAETFCMANYAAIGKCLERAIERLDVRSGDGRVTHSGVLTDRAIGSLNLNQRMHLHARAAEQWWGLHNGRLEQPDGLVEMHMIYRLAVDGENIERWCARSNDLNLVGDLGQQWADDIVQSALCVTGEVGVSNPFVNLTYCLLDRLFDRVQSAARLALAAGWKVTSYRLDGGEITLLNKRSGKFIRLDVGDSLMLHDELVLGVVGDALSRSED